MTPPPAVMASMIRAPHSSGPCSRMTRSISLAALTPYSTPETPGHCPRYSQQCGTATKPGVNGPYLVCARQSACRCVRARARMRVLVRVRIHVRLDSLSFSVSVACVSLCIIAAKPTANVSRECMNSCMFFGFVHMHACIRICIIDSTHV